MSLLSSYPHRFLRLILPVRKMSNLGRSPGDDIVNKQSRLRSGPRDQLGFGIDWYARYIMVCQGVHQIEQMATWVRCTRATA